MVMLDVCAIPRGGAPIGANEGIAIAVDAGVERASAMRTRLAEEAGPRCWNVVACS